MISLVWLQKLFKHASNAFRIVDDGHCGEGSQQWSLIFHKGANIVHLEYVGKSNLCFVDWEPYSFKMRLRAGHTGNLHEISLMLCSWCMMCNLTLAMNPSVMWIGVSLVLALAALFWRWFMPHWRATRARIRLICTCGYVPEPPTDAAIRVMRLVARYVVWMQVGRVDVSGRENLESGALRLITPTHGHYLDPFVIALLLAKPARCMAARGLLQSCGGLGALLFSQWGAFCTDLAEGKGGPALKAAVKILASDQTLVMFPEGWANMDGILGPFKNGAVVIARMAAAKAGRAVSIIPVHLRYGAYPGPWIRRFPTPLQCLLMLMGIVFFRRGVHVAVGNPLLCPGLPKHAAAATEELRRAVLILNPQSRENSTDRLHSTSLSRGKY
ncbi:MAG TPA: lysophospholipid acyltransferase family protein [Candidatus Angelobacter sp.]|jgi:1-acyl-sn-glycerol-3-phosphate acyltransferase